MYNMTNSIINNRNCRNKENTEFRRVQALAGEKSLLIVLPKVFAEKLKISKGDYLMVRLDNEGLFIKKSNYL
jgi:Antidote-toxin recognition MazE, bacterial antitoxin